MQYSFRVHFIVSACFKIVSMQRMSIDKNAATAIQETFATTPPTLMCSSSVPVLGLRVVPPNPLDAALTAFFPPSETATYAITGNPSEPDSVALIDFPFCTGDDIEGFRKYLESNSISVWHAHGGVHNAIDTAQRLHGVCNLYVGDASAATMRYAGNTAALAMAHGVRAADSVLAAMEKPPQVYSDGTLTYHFGPVEMMVIYKDEFLYKVPIREQTPSTVVIDMTMQSVVDGHHVHIKYAHGTFENNSFRWSVAPLYKLYGTDDWIVDEHAGDATFTNIC